MRKEFLRQLKISASLIFVGVLLPRHAWALNLKDYVAGLGFTPHSLSTGESVSFSSEGGVPGSIRQYKNNNYEQFIYKGDGIYRREDTSWAPLAGYMEASCSSGNRAGYTLVPGCRAYSNGSTITNTNGVFWAPNEANVGDTWTTASHQIVPIDTGIPLGEYGPMSIPPLVACTVPALSEYNGTGACNSAQTIQLTQKYGPGEFTFCTGATNPEEMIVLKVVGGPGTGDTFYYMKGWGLVGFKTDGLGTTFESGLSEGPGVEVGKMHAPDCTIVGHFKPKEPRTIVGRVTRAPVTLVNKNGKTVEVPHHPIKNARICVYEGLKDGKVQGIGDTIKRLVATTTTDEDGYFSVDTDLIFSGTEPSYNYGNFVAIFCGQRAEVLWTSIYMPTWEPLPTKYWKNEAIRALIQAKVPLRPEGTGRYPYDYNFKLNKEIVLPLEVELNCPVEPAQPYWNPEAEHPWMRPGYRYDDETKEIPECPEELAYVDRGGYNRAGWYNGLELGKKTEVPTIFHAEIKFGADDKYLGKPWSEVTNGAETDDEGNPRRKVALPKQKPEGWFNLAGAMSSLEEATAKITSFVFGGFTEPDFWPTDKSEDSDSAHFYSCEDIREANTATGELNPQKNAGFLSLMPPFTNTEENQDNPLRQVSPQLAYEKMNKRIKICYSEEYGDIELKDIQPPSRDYLPEDEQYKYCNPEIDDDCVYKLSRKYFPYFRVMKLGLTPREGPMQRAWEEADDSYVPDTSERRSHAYAHDPGEDETGRGYRTETKILAPSRRDNDFNATLAQISTDPIASPLNLILSPTAKNQVAPRPHGMAKTIIYKGLDKNVTSELDGHNENFYERYSVDSGEGGTAGIYDIKMSEINGERDDEDPTGKETFLEDTHRKTSVFSRVIQAIFDLLNPTCKQESDTEEEICTEEERASGDVECLPRLNPRGCEEDDDVECEPVGCERNPEVDCTVVYVKPKTVYGCTGQVEPVKMDIADKLKVPDISEASKVVDKAAAALLPPGVAEKMRKEANICVYDQYMEMTGTTGELESLEGKDIPCSEAPSLINPLKKAVSSPVTTID